MVNFINISRLINAKRWVESFNPSFFYFNVSKVILFSIFYFTFFTNLNAQDEKLSWRAVINNKDESWFSTEEAKTIANNVLLYQKDIGGWTKNIEIQIKLEEAAKKKLESEKSNSEGCTIDNGATIQEMIYLLKVYKHFPEEKFKISFYKGLIYLLTAQYKNGGWPQFYPLKSGYYSHITYNDDAIYNVLKLFKDILDDHEMISISVPNDIKSKIQTSFKKGIDCILKTQYKQNGVLTVWCAQHDKETLLPAKARAYELPSLSGKESAKLVLLLMSIPNPDNDIQDAVHAAVKWFDKTKIVGYKFENIIDEKTNTKDKALVESSSSDILWARFNDLEDNRPFFSDRSGKKKFNLNEISSERRLGYGWYTNEPLKVLKQYNFWRKAVQLSKQ